MKKCNISTRKVKKMSQKQLHAHFGKCDLRNDPPVNYFQNQLNEIERAVHRRNFLKGKPGKWKIKKKGMNITAYRNGKRISSENYNDYFQMLKREDQYPNWVIPEVMVDGFWNNYEWELK